MSPYASFEVTPEPERAETSQWESVEWHDGPTLLGFDYADVSMVGAVPAKEMGR